MAEGHGGGMPKVTGRDLMGNEGEEKQRGDKAMEGFEDQDKEFGVDTGAGWEPVEDVR